MRARLARRSVLHIALWAMILAPRLGAADSCRHWLAAQHDFGANRGFYLNFENTSDEGRPCTLGTLRLILGAADGQRWRFVVAQPSWQIGKEYSARGVIGAEGAELFLDGASIGREAGGFVPDAGPVTLNSVPAWANGRAEYVVRQLDARLTVAGKPVATRAFGVPSPDKVALSLFTPASGTSLPLAIPRGASLVIEARFRIEARPDLRTLAPFIDRYGQGIHSAWSGKIRSDADLKAAAREEKARLASVPAAQGFDKFGGSKTLGWREKATGFFRVTQRGGKWWLLTPDGNPCFYVGVCGVPMLKWEMTPVSEREFLYQWLPPKTGTFAEAWAKNQWGGTDGTEYVAFHTANMIRKYGAGWQAAAKDVSARRLRAFAFSGGGKWDALAGFPCLPVLWPEGVPSLVRHPDVFDAGVVQEMRQSFARTIGARKTDPMVVGWSVGNEYDEIVNKAEVAAILAKPAATPARKAMLAHVARSTYSGDLDRMARAWGVASAADLDSASVKPPDADVEAMRRFYEDAYYACLYKTLKQVDPNHLYLGNWIVPGWWENEEDWRIHARHCDVIGYDRYAPTFADAQLDRLTRETQKPILCGEFSFPPTYGGARGFGAYGTTATDDANAGDLYAKWIADAARNPYCVGGTWFMYRDQPLTGRGPGRGEELIYGEHYAFGIVDVADRPKWDLLTRMRKANLGAARLRAGR